MSEEERITAGSFKLSTLETLRADPLMEPIDHSLMGAYMQFMKWPSRQAYLSNLKARVLTGMISEPTISSSRARLVKHGYLKHMMKKLNGCDLFQVNNPDPDRVYHHVIIAEETLKERDAFRKSEERRIRAGKVEGVKETLAPIEQIDQSIFRDVTKESYDNSLEYTLEGKALKESNAFNSSYFKASRGG